MHKTPQSLVSSYCAAFSVGDLATIERCFHKDASIIGTQDGLFVTANRATYLTFLRGMGLARPTAEDREVQAAWEERQGRIATVCLIETLVGSKTVAHLSMLKTSEGWKFISKSFIAYPPGGQLDDHLC